MIECALGWIFLAKGVVSFKAQGVSLPINGRKSW
jgi:hypothetical protein